MRIILLLLMFSLTEAQNLNQLIKDAIHTHHSLESIQYTLSSMDERIAKTQKWENPNFSVTMNDIQLRKPLSRDEERMQYQAITLRQQFTWSDKLNARKNVISEEKHALFHTLESAKVALAYRIRTTVYTMKELEARIDIVTKTMQLAKQNIKLYTDYIATDAMSHNKSVEAELSLAKMEVKREHYKSLLRVQKEKLRYLIEKNIKKVSTTLRIIKPKTLAYYLKGVKKNPNYHVKLAQNNLAYEKKKLVDLDAIPDPYVQLGYVNRTDYPDYVSVSVGISLPIYGTEKLNSEIARKEILASKSESIDYIAKLQSLIRENYARLTESYRIYTILEHKSLPQLNHMLELSSSAIEEGADLFTYTNILEEKLSLEEERIAIMAESMRIDAKLKSLVGGI